MYETSPAPAWLPDWRDPSAYPDARQLWPDLWAWEFVRRNPRYRQLWKSCIRPFVDSSGHYDSDSAMDTRRRRHPRFARDPCMTIAKRFGLCHALPPEASAPTGIILSGNFARSAPERWVPLPSGGVRIELTGKLRHNEACYVLQLDAPIDPQLRMIGIFAKAASRQLARKGKITPLQSRAHIPKFPLYLRTLDAVEAHATWNKIAKVFYPNEENSVGNSYRVSKRIENFYEAACRIRDKDYRYLAFVNSVK